MHNGNGLARRATLRGPHTGAAARAQGATVREMERGFLLPTLRGDTAALSAARCVSMFLQRLGGDWLSAPAAAAVAGGARCLLRRTLADPGLLNCRPSAIAAAVVYAERRARGVIPFWPSVLAKLTKYQDMSSHELSLAIKARASHTLPYPRVHCMLSVRPWPRTRTAGRAAAARASGATRRCPQQGSAKPSVCIRAAPALPSAIGAEPPRPPTVPVPAPRICIVGGCRWTSAARSTLKRRSPPTLPRCLALSMAV